MEESGTSAGRHETKSVRLTVNGTTHHVDIGTGPCQIAPSHTLTNTLRETQGLKCTRTGCDQTTFKKAVTAFAVGQSDNDTVRRCDDRCLHELE